MKEKELKRLFESLTTKEKIYQLVQLSGEFFNADAMAVGPQEKLGIAQEVVDNAGSVLNVTGADKVRCIQEHYLKKSRHKIPLLFMADIIYGYHTIYPIPLGLGASWEPELAKRCNQMAAREACAAGAHVTFAPMVDLVRDARWGRCMESTGEDTYLNCEFAKAMVEGFQGGLRPGEGIASCVKHFAAYGAPEGGREYNTVDMSKRRLLEEYLPSYKAAVDAGCEMVMTSFNTVDEIPATANQWLMDEILRKEWGFDGVLITDYAAIKELIAHGVAEDDGEAARLAMEAGVDIDMKTACYANQLEPLMEQGKLSPEQIEKAAWRVLVLKNKLGLFEDPYRGADAGREAGLSCCDGHRTLAREAAAKSMVLLKNENHVLPLDTEKKVALIGPYADSHSLIGLWAVHGRQEDTVTLKEGFEEVFAERGATGNLKMAKGCDMLEDYSFLGKFGAAVVAGTEQVSTQEEAARERKKALKAAEWADVVVMALGEHMMQSGEAGSRTELEIPRIQKELLEEIAGLKKPVVLVLFSGRPLVLKGIEGFADAILEAWFPGTEGGHGVADVIFGRKNPSGRLSMCFPYSVGQMPLYYNGFQTGRPVQTSTHSDRFMSKYLDCPNTPLYPFGFGLSYHEAVYENLRVGNDRMAAGGEITVTVEVKNVGNAAGTETVQLYLQDVTGSVVRPVRELKGFQKVRLETGEKKTVSFIITEEFLKFYGKDMVYRAEPGRFKVYVGGNSRDTLEAEFYLTEAS